MMSKNVATVLGLSAIILWSFIAGLIKKVTMNISVDLSIALIYTCSALIVLAIFKLPNFKQISKKYLFWGTLLFVSYELSFAFAIGYTQSEQQAIEVNIINYLWPSLTILAFIIVKELKFNFLVIVGLTISILGIVFIQSGDQGFNFAGLIYNSKSNPLSYGLALIAAIIWAFYCVVTKKMSNGHNPISIFFIAAALTLWFKLLWFTPLETPNIHWSTAMYILVAALVVGLGYGAWNIGIVKGNITVLVAASYFSPVLSSMSSMLILQTQLSTSFWQGTWMVIAGSLICWISTNWMIIKRRLTHANSD